MPKQKSYEIFTDSVAALDARTDVKLKKYLVKTRTYQAIFANPRNIDLVVGLKGSGKRSLYNTLTQPINTNNTKVIRIGLSPADATWVHETQKMNLLQFSESAKVGLALYILRYLAENIQDYVEKAKVKAEIIKPFSGLLTRIKSLEGISVFGCGVKFKAPDQGRSVFKPIAKAERNSAVSLVKELVAAGFKIEVVTDDADRIFGGDVPDKHLLGGFILGCSDLKKQIEGLSVINIIKSHIKELLYTIEEFTNFSTRTVQYIAWEPDELSEVIEKRLKHAGLVWDDVFDFSQDTFVDFVQFKLRNGPRDMLRYIDLVLEDTVPGAKLKLEDFKHLEDDYRLKAFEQMQVVYGDVFVHIGDFVRELFKDQNEIDFVRFREQFEKMRLESRPSEAVYSQASFTSHKNALKAITESGCVDVHDGSQWYAPYREKYYKTINHNKIAKIRINYAIKL